MVTNCQFYSDYNSMTGIVPVTGIFDFVYGRDIVTVCVGRGGGYGVFVAGIVLLWQV